MANVRFIRTTKQKYLNRESYDPNALYFCTDTNEMFKGQDIYSDGIRVVQTHDDLPDCSCAADGVVYYVHDTRNGYTLSPDRTEWIQTIYAPAEDASTIPESEIYNTVTTVGAVRDIEAKIYQRIEEVASGGALSGLRPVDGTLIIANTADGGKSIGVAIAPDTRNALVAVEGGLFVPNYKAGDGIKIVDNEISVRLADKTHGLVAVDGTLALNLATKDSDGAMSKEDKAFIDSIPDVYVARKYEIFSKPEGTIVDYREKEIRVMCPADTEWALQNSGENADANAYYIGFKAYAPYGAVSFKEDLAEIIADNKMYYFENNEFAGVDKYSRRFSIVWLPVARNTDGVWTYYGETSTKTKYIGWYYTVEWFDANSKLIGTDTIRINLSNEGCHNNINAFYGVENDIATKVESIKESVANLQESCSWSEM